MPSDPRITRLLEEILESGRTPEDVCSDLELLPELRRRLEHLRRVEAEVDAMFPSTNAEAGESAARAHAAELPSVPGYDVESVLGRGGMGVVYKARHRKLGRDVAIKMVLAGRYAGADEVARFLREAQAVAALRSPNIVQIHDVGEVDGAPYFTMELLDGGSLAKSWGGVPQPARDAAALISTLAAAVQVAHGAGIVHRDLKPSNVLLTRDGIPKITDFGLARWLERETEFTLAGARLGTPSYMAPEQAMGRSSAVGTAVDVYALGALLYEMLTGRPPFRGETSAETERQVIAEEPAPPSKLNSSVPRDIETICLKCLSKDPTRRYITADALAADLHRFLRGEPILARPVGFLERTGKWVRRRPAHATVAAGTVLAVLCLVGAGLWLGMKRAAIDRAATEDLGEVDRATAAANWNGARTALERARARLMAGGSADLLALVEQGSHELSLIERLDAIRIRRAAVAYGKLDRAYNNSEADGAYEKAFREHGLSDVPGRPLEVAARIRNSRIRAVLVSALDTWATCVTGDVARRDGLLEAARLADPDPTGWRDRVRDAANWKDRKALAELVSAAPVSEESVMLLLALAEHAILAGIDAVPFLERIQQKHPDDFWSNFTLGLRLAEKSHGAAIRYFQAAVAVRPDSAVARGNLGTALGASGQVDEGIFQLREAVRIDPSLGLAHAILANCLMSKEQYAEAIEELRTALHLDPGLATTSRRCNLAGSLLELGQLDESIAEYREALRLDPRSQCAHYGLGVALYTTGHLEEAAEEQRRAIAIQPDPNAHEGLGYVLETMGRMDEAIESFRQAIRLDPRPVPVRTALVHVLIAQGRFEEAQTETRRLLESRPVDDPARPTAEALLKHCGLVHELQGNLAAILDGTRTPQDGAECLAFADLFRGRHEHAAAARYFADAFDRGAGPTAQQSIRCTVDAANCAALAATDGGDAGATVDDGERARFRALALAWLRDELEFLNGNLTAGAPGSRRLVLRSLVELRADSALARLHDSSFLETLPEAEESQWRALWSDVESLSERAKSLR